MLRDEFQMALRELEDIGREQLERLVAFEADALPPARQSTLASHLAQRRDLLDRLAELSRARDDLPGEGNLERAQFASVIDKLMAGGGLETSALHRLARGEQALGRRIDELSDLDWQEHERKVLDALAENAGAIADLLTNAAERH